MMIYYDMIVTCNDIFAIKTGVAGQSSEIWDHGAIDALRASKKKPLSCEVSIPNNIQNTSLCMLMLADHRGGDL